MRRRTVLARLFVSHALVIMVTLMAVGLLSSRLFADYYMSMRERDLERRAAAMASTLVRQGGRMSYDKDLLEALDKSVDARIIIADPSGRVLATTSSEVTVGSNLGPMPASPDRPRFRVPPTGFREPMMAVSVPIGDGQSVVGKLIIGAPSHGVTGVINSYRQLIVWAGLAALVLSVPVSYVMSRSIARPINEISKSTVKMVGGDFKQRINLATGDEIGNLADNVNKMASSIDTLFNQLADEKAQLEGLLSSMAEGVVAVDADSKITLINERAREVLALNEAQMPSTLADLGSLPFGEPLLALASEMQASGTSSALEFRADDRYLVVHGAFIHHAEKAAQGGLVFVLQDLTRILQAEELRANLITDVAHEFRTPLASIKAFSSAIEDMALDKPTRARYARTIQNEVDRLGLLVNDLLDASAGGTASSGYGVVDMALLAEDAALSLGAAGQKVIVEVQDGAAPKVSGDSKSLGRALLNLLDNAVRYSPQGVPARVQISYSESEVTVSVIDKGPGISEADLKHIWEKFYRVDKSRSRAEGGAGLGLSIVRDIIRSHGGSVSVESSVGAGSVFSFTLPLLKC